MTSTDIGVDRLTRTYIRIRDAKAELAAKHKTEMDALDEQMDAVKHAMLEYLSENNVESVRTAEGLVYRTTKTRYWTNDWESMHRFILDNELPEFLEKRLNQSAVKDYLSEHPDAPLPGLSANTEYVITVRKK